jgi:F0F1-type ATP synthase beta subunit
MKMKVFLTEALLQNIHVLIVNMRFEGALSPILNPLEAQGVEHRLVLELAQQLGKNMVLAVAMEGADGMALGRRVLDTSTPNMVSIEKETPGRIINLIGEPIDELGPSGAKMTYAIHRPAAACTEMHTTARQLLTSIWVVDLLASYAMGKSDWSLRWCWRRQNGCDRGLSRIIALKHGGSTVFAHVGERTREGNGLYHEMKTNGGGQGNRLCYQFLVCTCQKGNVGMKGVAKMRLGEGFMVWRAAGARRRGRSNDDSLDDEVARP